MPVDELVGTEINDFKIIERIGRGGMAMVYRAEQLSMRRDVALKVIRLDEDIQPDDDFPQRFAQEAEVIASLEHIHILPVYSYGISDGVAYLAMRLLDGGSLEDLLLDDTVMPLERVVDLFTQVAQGLAHAHSKGVLHRDLKPSNVLLDSFGHAYLMDFGLAKVLNVDTNVTASGNIVGTPAYMSPEQLRGEPLDYRSDVYSMGIILYQMLTGRRPFIGDSSDVVAVIYMHLEQPPTPPHEYNPALTQEIETVVLKALEKNREDRYSSMAEMAQQLKLAAGLESENTLYPRPARLLQTQQRERAIQRRRWLMRAGITLIVLALVMLAGVAILPGITRDPLPAIATVIPGEVGIAADLKPSEGEVQQVKQRLGTDGFVAVVACNLTSAYHSTQTRELSDFTRQYDLPTRIYDSESDEYTQVTEIERARAEGASGFIICPLSEDLLAEPLASMQANNVPVVMPDYKGDTYGGVLVRSDNYQMGLVPGQLAGEIIRDEMDGQARVVVLEFPEPAIMERANGLIDGVEERAPDAEIVARVRGATQAFARESIMQLIDEGVEFDVIVSINDAGSFGAIEALEEAGFTPDSVIITSVDAEPLALRYIREGHFMRGSLEVGRREFAEAAVDVLVKLLAGSTVPESVIIPNGEIITRAQLEAESES